MYSSLNVRISKMINFIQPKIPCSSLKEMSSQLTFACDVTQTKDGVKRGLPYLFLSVISLFLISIPKFTRATSREKLV